MVRNCRIASSMLLISGFEGDGRRDGDGCHDIDECATDTDDCSRASEECVNEIGSYRCECRPGFEQTPGRSHCTGTNLLSDIASTIPLTQMSMNVYEQTFVAHPRHLA
eukprot:Blabericola_migrator_1__7437@NODE_378_length_9209_cov_129_909101_g302_i0_p10_GENE_NODE_378_length_9209_cov_129_909101_g302_i0NODE_378_length_9209_cov_129_909101_g302_i0_p10_ORF_typecomplete_len108_score2_45EGF_CA/PF07645_15/3_4e13EGF_3/PF12947_7/58EGF_3/PF12947_7/9_2e03EGF_3/PF12947_7/8_9e07EGF_3/PF12947_7/2_1e03FXa_inhibition/PF14670_6/1e05hEGF/PF12661_7/7_1e05cEGF/PF12662_7/2cEGF/PF12662_7/0_00067EGF/PF00008_27/0_00024EGF_MSP1_1/PF12946_7/7_6e03EGF_MSP1_1/PF12946_7/0_00088Plasmod_Pvs28/PF06247